MSRTGNHHQGGEPRQEGQPGKNKAIGNAFKDIRIGHTVFKNIGLNYSAVRSRADKETKDGKDLPGKNKNKALTNLGGVKTKAETNIGDSLPGKIEGGDRNKEDDRNKGDRNDRIKGTIAKGNSYLLANPRPAEPPDNGTVVQTAGADRSAPGTQPEHNNPHTQNLTSGASQVIYQEQKGLHQMKRLLSGQASSSGIVHHKVTKMFEGIKA